jgi:hypothetical protein
MALVRDLGALELYVHDPAGGGLVELDASTPAPARRLPVLFVHGHDLVADVQERFPLIPWPERPPSHVQNWHEDVSFQATLDLAANAALDIEPYYIHFADRHRSIVADAVEIREAVATILHRHDPAFDPDLANLSSTTPVKVAIIAYSKGTISARLAVKSLYVQVPGMPAPRPVLRPVSELVAISPPNHGLRPGASFDDTTSTALRQLFNGHDGSCVSYGDDTEGFIADLNGHPIEDSAQGVTLGPYPSEAEGSRADGEPLAEGTLYVQIFAAGNADRVGGDTPSSDCQGRELASNLAPDAADVLVSGIPGSTEWWLDDDLAVHDNTVHTPAVICIAVYTVVHHRLPAPPVEQTCPFNATTPPVVPAPAGTVVGLALDHSGSMLQPACAGCASRLEYLRDAVELFLDLWSLVGTPQDAIAVTYFRTEVDPPSATPQPLQPNQQAIIFDLLAQSTTPQQMTAMGGAVYSALQNVQGDSPNRHVILFTDGIQNVNPMIRPDTQSPPGLVFVDEPGRVQSNVAVAPGLSLVDAAQGVPVDVIGVIETQPVLDDIALDTGGLAKLTTDIEQLRQFFVEQLVNALRGSSPQLVAYRRGAVPADGVTETFRLGGAGRKVALVLAWTRGPGLDLRVERGGIDLTDSGRVVEGRRHRIFELDLPARAEGAPVTSAGEWQLHITGPAGTAYEAAAVVDEARLRYRVGLGTRAYRAGDDLELELRLFDGDAPVDTGVEVSATVSRPRHSIENLLGARRKGGANKGLVERPAKPAALEARPTKGRRAIARLLRDPAVWKALVPATETVALTSRGDGIFRGALSAAVVNGPYSVAFHIAGHTAELGAFTRTETVSTRVRFGAPDLEASGFRATRRRASGGRDEVTLRLAPRDRHGNYLGPDRGGDIDVRVNGRSMAEGLLDSGDGGYAITLAIPRGSDPTVSLRIVGAKVLSGDLSSLLRRDRASRGRALTGILIGLLVIFLWGLVRRHADPMP